MQKNAKGWAIEVAYEKIRKMMYYNELVPGQKLIYGDLARKIGMSLTPVIQSLYRLKDANLVDHRPNRGFFVREITKREVEELYEVRTALETYIAPSIVRNLNTRKLNGLRQSFREYRSKDRDHRLLILKDAQFHLTIARFADNAVALRLLNGIFEEICIKYRPEYMGEERVQEAAKEHRKILNALEKRDVQKTILAIKEHNQKGKDHILGTLEKYETIRL